MVCDAVEERGGHFCASKDGTPFLELEVCCKDDRRGFVEFSNQVKEQAPTGFGKRDVSQLVHDDAI